MNPRHRQIIAMGKRIERVKGPTYMTLDVIGDEFGITGTSVDRILQTYTKATGHRFNFRNLPRVRNRALGGYGTGICLLCKRATEHPVQMYLDGADCFACGNTGYYVAAIMEKRGKGKCETP